MSFVSNYDHDLFVSYAHTDDESSAGASGWVTTLVQNLDREVRQRLGSKLFSIWIDHELRENKPLTQEILGQLRRSATLMVIMSPSYLNSEWCKRESQAFLSYARDCVASGRIFIVHCRETERGKVPPEFGDLVGFKFWVEDVQPRRVTRPLGSIDPKEKEYVMRVYELSEQIARELKEMASSAGSLVGEPAPPGGSIVFIARSTEDLEDREAELKAYLRQAGVDALPKTWYPEGSLAAFKAAMEADLKRCRLYVQLLSNLRGREVESGVGKRYPQLQCEIAKATGIPVLQWRDPALDFREVDDNAHRELLDGARACGIEEFKRTVVEQAFPSEAGSIAPPPETVLTFVDANPEDLQIAREVGDFLAAQGVATFWPIARGSAKEVREDLKHNLLECDGVVLVYGAAEPFWVRDQYRQIRKIAAHRRREHPLAALALYIGPPPQKTDLGFRIPDAITFDCRQGVNLEVLKVFVGKLRSTGKTS